MQLTVKELAAKLQELIEKGDGNYYISFDNDGLLMEVSKVELKQYLFAERQVLLL